MTPAPTPSPVTDALSLLSTGLSQLLAAVHADDPKRELLVRVGDLMRETKSIAAALDGMVVQGWRTIDSAPVEQTIDIICQEEGEEQHRFCDVTIVGCEPHAFTFEDTSGKHTYFPHENGMWITHWMPLPAAPAAKGE